MKFASKEIMCDVIQIDELEKELNDIYKHYRDVEV